EKLTLTVKRLGRVTGALFEKKPGELVGIRGPYGNGWPMKEIKGKSVLVVAGGVGLPPLRPVIYEILRNRSNYGDVHLCYGARTPADLVFCDEMKEWAKGINTHQTVDVCGAAWMGDVGFVAKLVDKHIKKEENLIALMCGPSIMMTAASKALLGKDCKKSQIYVSLERLMHCGIGKCGHCMAGGKYVCQDGPVFRLDEMEGLSESLL
ncbi:MAG: FAD/NAD(P)-binding protein, partial [Candidatus Micrarchaeota archaeon]|nr:FAD/NAD(P)-binding protein [Candidatus Micrarchaeota archaeon]